MRNIQCFPLNVEFESQDRRARSAGGFLGCIPRFLLITLRSLGIPGSVTYGAIMFDHVI